MKSLVFSLLVSSAVSYLGWELFLYYLYEPLTATVIVALLVAWFRFRSLRSGLPAPYGRGRVSIIDEKASMRSGLLLVLGGIISVGGLMASVYLLPPELYFIVLIGVVAGLPLSQAVYFALVASVEATSRSRVLLATEETTRDGVDVLVKTVEMVPRDGGLDEILRPRQVENGRP
ncbi:MAG: hypothetical protein ACLP9K_05560 [Nitrososphaerales archaeon]